MKRLLLDRLMHLFLTPITIIFIVLIVLGINCKKDNTDYSIHDLLGTWEFVAFGASDGSLKTIERYDCEDCYTITIYEDTTITGRSYVNTLAKAFILSGNHISFPWGVLSTEVGELGDSHAFTEAFRDVSSFEIENNQLKLFYADKIFLLFNFKTN